MKSCTLPLRGIVPVLTPLLALVGADQALAEPASAPAPEAPAAVTPLIDLKDPANIEAGREFFQVTCSHYCHGKDARGGGMRGPSLRNRNFDNAYLFGRISNGFPPMPAFKDIYTPDQIWKLIAYIQSLKD